MDITTDKITEYIRARQEAGVKPATIHYDLSILKRMFTLAVQAEKLDRRPHIPSIEVRNVRTGFFSESEFLSVLSRLPEDIKPLVEFLAAYQETQVWAKHGQSKAVQDYVQ